MKLTIDNFDSLGPVDYTPALDPQSPLRLLRRLNRPAELRVSLVADHPGFVVPVDGGRVVVVRNGGAIVFTGYIVAAPQYEYLGWGERGPIYRYTFSALSDELLLDRKQLPERGPFVNRTGGDILKNLTDSLLAGAFDTSSVQDVDTVPSFSSDPRRTWSEHAADLALRVRAGYRAMDARLFFTPIGATTYSLSEGSPGFCPDGLKLHSPDRLLNDVTVAGRFEPRAYVKDYFIGDGVTLGFDLSQLPFTRFARSLFEDEFKGSTLDTLRWTRADPLSVVSLGGGALQVTGGDGQFGQTTVSLSEQVELGGGVVLQHGEISFTAASDGVVGGLYSGGLALANCFAGFRITPSGGQSVIQPLINGVATGSTLTTAAGHLYALTTRLYASQIFRREQTFHSSAHPAGSGRGGSTIAADVRLVLEVHDIDPASPGSVAAPSTVLYDNVITGAPGFCIYALVNAANLHCSIPFARVIRAVNTEVRSALPLAGYRTRLVGFVSEGAECRVFNSPALVFHDAYVPAANEQIVVRYRGRGRALARITDPASIAAQARGPQDGQRAGVRTVAFPAPRTAVECETAALALLDDSTQPSWAGEYETWSDCFPGVGADVFPGDALAFNIPSRGLNSTVIVREVELQAVDLDSGRSRYRIVFANDAAEPLSFAFDPAAIDPLEEEIAIPEVGASYVADLPNAEVTAITSTTVTIDAGADPIPGGGFEVRRIDFGWGADNHRELAGRFTTRTFNVTRLVAKVDFFVRQFDASTPRRYSRYSTALHIGYPYP